MANDLAFSELAAALPAGAVTFTGGEILVHVGVITGDTYTALTDLGVVEFMYKIRSACTDAQTTSNATLDAGEAALAAFPNFAYGIPTAAGEVPVTQITAITLPLNTGTV